MLRLRIADLCEGHSEQRRQASAEDLELLSYEEFQAPIDIRLAIEKNGDQIIVTAELQTMGSYICDRCLEPYNRSLADVINLLYTSDLKLKNEEDDTIFYIPAATKEVDLVDPLRQTLILALPLKRLCNEDCKGLCVHCGANLNITKCKCPTGRVDPRWEKLKDLL